MESWIQWIGQKNLINSLKFVCSSTDIAVRDKPFILRFAFFPYRLSPGRVEYQYKFAWVNRSPSQIGNLGGGPVGIEDWPIVGIGEKCRAKYIRRLCSRKLLQPHSGFLCRGENIRGKGLLRTSKLPIRGIDYE